MSRQGGPELDEGTESLGYEQCTDTGRHSAHEWRGGERWCEGQEADFEAGQ